MIKTPPRTGLQPEDGGYVSTAVTINRYRTKINILAKAGVCAAVLAIVLYIVSILYARYGSFSVSVNKFDSQEYALTLSEDPNFNNRTVQLNAKISEDITNISVNDIPDNVDEINGSHCGDNYIAYTFYLMNAGVNTVSYEYYINIINATSNLDSAIRVMLYYDEQLMPGTSGRQREIFAKTRTDGTGPEAGTTAFQYNDADSITTVLKRQENGFVPGDTRKFTIVIWIEGDDDDCKDELIGGTMKVNMVMSVVESGGAPAESTTESTTESAN